MSIITMAKARLNVPGKHLLSGLPSGMEADVLPELVGNAGLGKALAGSLGDKPVVLMRGHGAVMVGPSIPLAVFRAVYTEVNARMQQNAIMLGGTYTALEPEEGTKADKVNEVISARPWELWKKKAMGK